MVWLPLFILLLGLPHARGGYSDGNYAEPECWVDTVLQPDCAILGDVLPRWDPAMPLEWTVDEPTSLQFWLDGEDPRHVRYGDGPVYHANVHLCGFDIGFCSPYGLSGCAQLITQTQTRQGDFDTMWHDAIAAPGEGRYTAIAHFRWDAFSPTGASGFCDDAAAANCSRVDTAVARLVEVNAAAATSTRLPRGIVVAAQALAGCGVFIVGALFAFFFHHRRSPVVRLSDEFSGCLIGGAPA